MLQKEATGNQQAPMLQRWCDKCKFIFGFYYKKQMYLRGTSVGSQAPFHRLPVSVLIILHDIRLVIKSFF